MFQTVMLGLDAIFFMIVARWAAMDEEPDPVLTWGIALFAAINLTAAILR